MEPVCAVGSVGTGAIHDDFGGIVADQRVFHPQRLEEVAVGPGPKRLSRDFGDRCRQQVVARVGILLLLAGREIQFALAPDHFEDGVQRNRPLHVHVREGQGFRPVAQAARVMDEVIDRDRLPEIRHVRQILVNVVVERELPLLNEHRHGQPRELFGHRGDVK